MNRVAIHKTGLDLLYYSGVSRALSGMYQGIGAIFMLHHIRPGSNTGNGFTPNSSLEITPEFLDIAIQYVKHRGYELISIEEAHQRLMSAEPAAAPFVVFTIDDGYKDNYEHAWPVFRRHDCPFTIFITTSIIDGTCELWWQGLEKVIAGQTEITFDLGDGREHLSTATKKAKQEAFRCIYTPLRAMEEHQQRRWIRRFCEENGVDLDALCREQAMTWDDVREISRDPLCTIGAHTVNHFAVKKLDAEEALKEAITSRERIGHETGKTPIAFAYPYGDETSVGDRDFEIIKSAGFDIAVTTRSGVVLSAHREQLTSVPRVSLNGGFQKPRYLDVLLSGTSFGLARQVKKIIGIFGSA